MSKRKVYFKYLGEEDVVRSLIEFLSDLQDEDLNETERPNEVPESCIRDGKYIICRDKKYLEYLCLDSKWYYRYKYDDMEIMMMECQLYPPSFCEKDMNFIFKYKKYVTKRALSIANSYRMSLNIRNMKRMSML